MSTVNKPQTYPEVTVKLTPDTKLQQFNSASTPLNPVSNRIYMQALFAHAARLANLEKEFEKYITEHHQSEYVKQIFHQMLRELKEESKRTQKFEHFAYILNGNAKFLPQNIIKLPASFSSNPQFKSLVEQINSDLNTLAERELNIANLQQTLGGEDPNKIATVDENQLKAVDFKIVPTPSVTSSEKYEDEDEADYYLRWKKGGLKDKTNGNTFDLNGFDNRLFVRNALATKAPIETLEQAKKAIAVLQMALYRINVGNVEERLSGNLTQLNSLMSNTKPMAQAEVEMPSIAMSR